MTYLESLKTEMLFFKGVSAKEKKDSEGCPLLDITVPTNAGDVTVSDIDESTAAGIQMAGRGVGFSYHSENFFKTYIESIGFEIQLRREHA